jgi:ankyrin repeat protein
MRTLALVLLAFAIPLALAENRATPVAAMLPGGSAQDTALREAAISHNIEAVKAALEKAAHVSAPSSTARPVTPLGAAAVGDWRNTRDRAADLSNNEIAKRLAQNGMNDHDINKYLAVEITNLLFAAGAKLGPFDRDILFKPIADGNERLVQLLIDHGASVTDKIEGYTPPELAKKYDQEPVYKLLVARGGVPVDSSSSAQLKLIEVAGNGLLLSGENITAEMESAIRQGARVNGTDSDNYTALIAALRAPIFRPSQVIPIRWLLEHGADPNQKGESGFTEIEGLPLHIFVAGNKQTLAGTLRNSPDVAKSMAEEVLSLLLKFGAKISGMDSQDRSPLHVAAMVDNVRAAEILIHQGAKVMPRDKQGKSPLDYAESAAMIKLLKDNGAVER